MPKNSKKSGKIAKKVGFSVSFGEFQPEKQRLVIPLDGMPRDSVVSAM